MKPNKAFKAVSDLSKVEIKESFQEQYFRKKLEAKNKRKEFFNKITDLLSKAVDFFWVKFFPLFGITILVIFAIIGIIGGFDFYINNYQHKLIKKIDYLNTQVIELNNQVQRLQIENNYVYSFDNESVVSNVPLNKVEYIISYKGGYIDVK